MNAIETLHAMNATYQHELAGVRDEYGKLPLACTQRLCQRHNLPNAQDAMHEEARQRCLRNKWAKVQS